MGNFRAPGKTFILKWALLDLCNSHIFIKAAMNTVPNEYEYEYEAINMNLYS